MYYNWESHFVICYPASCASCIAISDLPKYEPNSVFADPVFTDPANGNFRASATSPTSMWNRGYYAGTNEIRAVTSTRALLTYLAPAAGEACTVTTSVNSDFSNPLENAVSDGGGDPWRRFVIGRSTPLNPSTTYYYKVACGYDVVTGDLTTAAGTSGSATLSVAVNAPPGLAGVDHAVLETSADGTAWTTGPAAPCSSTCTLTAALPVDQILYRRWRFRSAASVVLATSQAEPVVVR